ncbi:lysophospholipid acyltransferase family protein [Gordonia sp. VNQ95]|uniref:lysophospholipid acyltransferase family protein n=1 Tax=Gordonia sp. VNQ95 TaxID=3156619 RepID=UPI0032B3E29F
MFAESHKRDPGFVERVAPILHTICKVYFRSEVYGLDNLPAGGNLIVSNHSGGTLTVDVAVLGTEFINTFGPERPSYVLGHDMMFRAPGADQFRKAGFIRASRDNAASALRDGGTVMVFPGGDYDVYRPFTASNTIDFNGRVGYVTTAIDAGVPIVPSVSIGGQENALYLSRGTRLARALQLPKLLRTDVLPISIGFPFGLSVLLPINVPLPTKIVTRVLEPIDVVAEFGPDPDVHAVDREVRQRMQVALDELASQRRFPIIG